MIKKITTIVILISISIAAVFGIFYVIKKNRFEAEGKVLIQGARAKSNAAIEKRALDFKEFIESKKTGAKPFSQEVIGLRGFWGAGKCIRLNKEKLKNAMSLILMISLVSTFLRPTIFGMQLNAPLKAAFKTFRALKMNWRSHYDKSLLADR